MRVIVTGDRRWYCPDLAEGVLNRLMLRHGPTFVIVHGGATGRNYDVPDRLGSRAAEAAESGECEAKMTPRHFR